ncbi:hypothetical protein ACJX0J_016972, partial [Zea mays]
MPPWEGRATRSLWIHHSNELSTHTSSIRAKSVIGIQVQNHVPGQGEGGSKPNRTWRKYNRNPVGMTEIRAPKREKTDYPNVHAIDFILFDTDLSPHDCSFDVVSRLSRITKTS